MPKKPQPKWDDPNESERFLETAKAVEASEDPKDFERAVNAITAHPGLKPKSRD